MSDHHTWTNCITCGVLYAIPTAMYRHQQEKGGYHYCPNGHYQGWSKEGSELAKLRRERDIAKQQIARAEDEAREARRHLEKAQEAARKLKKRTAAGTCPCCQRSFANMAQHMKHRHPGYVKETGANVVAIGRVAK